MLWKMEFFLNETLILLIQLQGILDCDSPISGLLYSLYIAKKTPELHLINFMCLQSCDHVWSTSELPLLSMEGNKHFLVYH